MNAEQENKNRRASNRLFVFYSILSISGLVLSYWFGIGWFILFHTIRGVFSSVPSFSIPIMRVIAGLDYAEELRGRYALKNATYRFFSTYVVNLINIAITIFVFWKLNIPLKQIFR